MLLLTCRGYQPEIRYFIDKRRRENRYPARVQLYTEFMVLAFLERN